MNRSLTIGLTASAAVLCAVWMQGRAISRATPPGSLPSTPDIQSEPDARMTAREPQAFESATPRASVAGPPHAPPAAAEAVTPMYTMPSDPADLGKRFFGEEAEAIAKKWQTEQISPKAKQVEAKIFETYDDADARYGVHAVECRNTLCRIDLDRAVAVDDHTVVKRMAGKLGAVGWLLNGSSSDELIAFVPIDFKPLDLEPM
jgi:hypothetical protein